MSTASTRCSFHRSSFLPTVASRQIDYSAWHRKWRFLLSHPIEPPILEEMHLATFALPHAVIDELFFVIKCDFRIILVRCFDPCENLLQGSSNKITTSKTLCLGLPWLPILNHKISSGGCEETDLRWDYMLRAQMAIDEKFAKPHWTMTPFSSLRFLRWRSPRWPRGQLFASGRRDSDWIDIPAASPSDPLASPSPTTPSPVSSP